MATLRRVDRVRDAIHDLKSLILARYPEAEFRAVKGFDPPGTYLEVMVPRVASGEVFGVIEDRLVELLDEGPLPLYVMPIRPREPIN